MLEMIECYDNVNVTCSSLILTKTQAYWSLARNYRSGGLWFQLQLESHREGNKLLFFAGFLPIRSKIFYPMKNFQEVVSALRGRHCEANLGRVAKAHEHSSGTFG